MALEFPASPTNGQLYPAAPNSEYIYSTAKGAWLSLPTESAKTVTSDNAPSNPKDGDQWFNTVDGTLYIYIVDVDGGQWVESQAPITANGYYSPNYIINGAFDIWQRGTSFVNPTDASYTSDRWQVYRFGSTVTVSRQPLNINISGNEAQYFFRYAKTAGTGDGYIVQKIEDVRTLAGKTMTISFWAKADAAKTFDIYWEQAFGTGGSSAVIPSGAFPAVSVTTDWKRFSYTFTVPSVVGKTIGDGSSLAIVLRMLHSVTGNISLDVWGMQVEEGSIATTFRRNANSIQGELAACQRYAFFGGAAAFGRWGSSTTAELFLVFPVPMRVAPSVTQINTYNVSAINVTGTQVTSTTLASSTINSAQFNIVAIAGSSGAVAGTTSNGLLFSAEL